MTASLLHFTWLSDTASGLVTPTSTMNPNVWWWMALGVSGAFVILLIVALLIAWCCVYHPCNPSYHTVRSRGCDEREAEEEATLADQSSTREATVKQDTLYTAPQITTTTTTTRSLNGSEVVMLLTPQTPGVAGVTPTVGNPLGGPHTPALADATRQLFDTAARSHTAPVPHNDEMCMSRLEAECSCPSAAPQPRSIVLLPLSNDASAVSTPNRWLHPTAPASNRQDAMGQLSRRHPFVPTQRRRRRSVTLDDADNVPMVYATPRRTGVASAEDERASVVSGTMTTGVAPDTVQQASVAPAAAAGMAAGQSSHPGGAVTVTVQRSREHVLESAMIGALSGPGAHSSATVSADAAAKAVERMIAIAVTQTPVPLRTRPVTQLPVLHSPPPESTARRTCMTRSKSTVIATAEGPFVTPRADVAAHDEIAARSTWQRQQAGGVAVRQSRRRSTPRSVQRTTVMPMSNFRTTVAPPLTCTSGSQRSPPTTSLPSVRPTTAATFDVVARGSNDSTANAEPTPMTTATLSCESRDTQKRHCQSVHLTASTLEARKSNIAGVQIVDAPSRSVTLEQHECGGDRYDDPDGDDEVDSVLNSSVGGGGSELSVATVPATRVAAARMRSMALPQTDDKLSFTLHSPQERLPDVPPEGNCQKQQQQQQQQPPWHSSVRGVSVVSDAHNTHVARTPSVAMPRTSLSHPSTKPQPVMAETTTTSYSRRCGTSSRDAHEQSRGNPLLNSSATESASGFSRRHIFAGVEEHTSLDQSVDRCLRSSDLLVNGAPRQTTRHSPSTPPRASHDALARRPPLHRTTPASLHPSRVAEPQTLLLDESRERYPPPMQREVLRTRRSMSSDRA